MGQDKALLPIGGETLIESQTRQLHPYFDEILISLSPVQDYDFLSCSKVIDPVAGQGPMMGLSTALGRSRNEKNFVVSCDIPDIDMAFVRRMVDLADGCDIVVPLSARNTYEPLFAVYSRWIKEEMSRLLAAGERSLLALFDILDVRTLSIEGELWFKNLNTRQDYEDYLKERGLSSDR